MLAILHIAGHIPSKWLHPNLSFFFSPRATEMSLKDIFFLGETPFLKCPNALGVGG